MQVNNRGRSLGKRNEKGKKRFTEQGKKTKRMKEKGETYQAHKKPTGNPMKIIKTNQRIAAITFML